MSTRNWHLLLSVSLFWTAIAFGSQCGHVDQQRADAERRADHAEAEVRRLRAQLSSDQAACDTRVHALRNELDDVDAHNATLTINTRALSHDVVVLSEDLQRCRGIR